MKPTKEQIKIYNQRHREYKKLWQRKRRSDPTYQRKKYPQGKYQKNKYEGTDDGNEKWKALKDFCK